MDVAVDREALGADLGRGGYLQGTFVRGAVQGHWFQTDLVLTRPGILRRCAELLAARIPENTDRIAARGATAVALATSVALRVNASLLLGESGAGGDVEFVGDYFPGARVVVIEDIVLTGRHAGESVRALSDAGLTVLSVVALIDRGRSGRHHLEAAENNFTYLVEFLEDELLP
jgi:orotate phosphoribosyltransferase